MADEFEITEVQRLRIEPGDKIVIRCQDRISSEAAMKLHEILKRAFPDHEVLILDSGATLEDPSSESG